MTLPPRIKNAQAVSENMLLVEFSNGEFKKFNISLVLNRPNFQALSNFSFFKNLKVDTSGYSIYWSDEIDLSENELWQKGTPVT